MPLLDQHPPHVRHKIAVAVTIAIAAVLFAILIIVYTHKRSPDEKASSSTLNDFYTTIIRPGQSSSDLK